MLKNWVDNLVKKIQKIPYNFHSINNRYDKVGTKIEEKNKSLIALRWNWNALIPRVKFFLESRLIHMQHFVLENC